MRIGWKSIINSISFPDLLRRQKGKTKKKNKKFFSVKNQTKKSLQDLFVTYSCQLT